MFYIYDQNNSGGGFTVDEDVTYNVIIEADSADEANRKAEEIGIYFDDNYEYDCECCGTRWSRAWSNEGEETPMIYGDAVEDYYEAWVKGGEPYAHVYYKDGTKRSYTREETTNAPHTN
jgi:hypothetical protein